MTAPGPCNLPMMAMKSLKAASKTARQSFGIISFAVLLVPVEKGRQCKLFCERNIKIKTILIVIILM